MQSRQVYDGNRRGGYRGGGGGYSRGVQRYPVKTLQLAGERFRSGWLQSASCAGSWAHRVHNLHLSHPPGLRVLNQLPNPHDSPMMPPTLNGQPQVSLNSSQNSFGSQSMAYASASVQQTASQSQAAAVLSGIHTSQSYTSTALRHPNSCQSVVTMDVQQVNASQSQASPELDYFNPSQLQAGPNILSDGTQSQLFLELRQPTASHRSDTASRPATEVAQSQGLSELRHLVGEPQHRVEPTDSSAPTSSLGKRSFQPASAYESSSVTKRPCDQADSPAKATDSTSGAKSTSTMQCDICCLCKSSSVEMQQHLSVSGHATASKCQKSSDSSSELVIVSPSCLKRHRGQEAEADVEILCPNCALLIGSRFACGLHYSLEHQTGREMWAARPVVHRQRLDADPSRLACSGSACNQPAHFAKFVQLHKHWRSHPACCPVTPIFANLPQMQLLMVVACTVCQRLFLGKVQTGSLNTLTKAIGPFVAARSHLIERHQEVQSSAQLLVTLIDLAGGRVSQVPPMDLGVKQAHNWSLQLARQLADRMRCFVTSKRTSSMRRLRRHIKDLRSCGGKSGGTKSSGATSAAAVMSRRTSNF